MGPSGSLCVGFARGLQFEPCPNPLFNSFASHLKSSRTTKQMGFVPIAYKFSPLPLFLLASFSRSPPTVPVSLQFLHFPFH